MKIASYTLDDYEVIVTQDKLTYTVTKRIIGYKDKLESIKTPNLDIAMNLFSDIVSELDNKVDTCNGEDIICEEYDCQTCCPHNEFDHDICLDCGYERDPGIAIDRAYDLYSDE